jgi:DNA polymerase elongation subunit (family B)
LYGAILNPGCRFFDKRIGQSTTLTGRAIARHMDAYVNECITGKYDHVGESIIYGDTDSCYFTAWPAIKDEVANGNMEWSKETCIQLYDSIADQVNESFPSFMEQAFHCPREAGELIKAGRELVASNSLFITKKRYAVLIYDLENKRLDVDGSPGKIKAMGLDLKRSDTPKVIQDFLSEILQKVLTGTSREEIVERIREFKYSFAERPAWEKGTPKRVNNLTKYGAAEERGSGVRPAPWPVDIEETQPRQPDPVEVRVGVSHHLVALLRGPVEGQWPIGVALLPKRRLHPRAVDAAR